MRVFIMEHGNILNIPDEQVHKQSTFAPRNKILNCANLFKWFVSGILVKLTTEKQSQTFHHLHCDRYRYWWFADSNGQSFDYNAESSLTKLFF